jgi:hypothetical protein
MARTNRTKTMRDFSISVAEFATGTDLPDSINEGTASGTIADDCQPACAFAFHCYQVRDFTPARSDVQYIGALYYADLQRGPIASGTNRSSWRPLTVVLVRSALGNFAYDSLVFDFAALIYGNV